MSAKSKLPQHLRPGNIKVMEPKISRGKDESFIYDDNYAGLPMINGERVLVIVENGEVHYQDRNGKLVYVPAQILDNVFVELSTVEVCNFTAHPSYILDGVLTHVSLDGVEHMTVSDVVAANSELGREDIPGDIVYYALDALVMRGEDITGWPKWKRVREACNAASVVNDLLRDQLFLDDSVSVKYFFPAIERRDKEKMIKEQKEKGRMGIMWYRQDEPYTKGKRHSMVMSVFA